MTSPIMPEPVATPVPGPVSATASSAAPEAAAAARPLVQVDGLKMYLPITSGILFSRHVGDVRAVDGIDLSIQKGETLGLVG